MPLLHRPDDGLQPAGREAGKTVHIELGVRCGAVSKLASDLVGDCANRSGVSENHG